MSDQQSADQKLKLSKGQTFCPNVDRFGTLTATLGSLPQCLTTIWVRKCLLMSDLNLPWSSFNLFSREEPNTSLNASPSQEAVRSNEITPHPLFSNLDQESSATHHKYSFQPSHQLCCSPASLHSSQSGKEQSKRNSEQCDVHDKNDIQTRLLKVQNNFSLSKNKHSEKLSFSKVRCLFRKTLSE